jgi:hypothetical protein
MHLKCIFIIGAFAPMSQNTMFGNPLWLTGIDAPITKNHISECIKKKKKS